MSSAGEGHTVLGLINKSAAYLSGKGALTPRLDAEVLLSEILGCSRIALYVGFDRVMTQQEVDAYRTAIIRRGRREPVAYIIGRKEFFGRSFAVSAGTLIPRPETELLVELGIEALSGRTSPMIAEVCCGSGAPGISTALERPDCELVLSDISDVSLASARRNALEYGIGGRTRFFLSDLFDEWPAELKGSFDLIMANPPYIKSDDIDGLEPEISVHEPRLALDGGPDGLRFYCRIAEGALRHLKSGGSLILEVGNGQAAAVGSTLECAGFKEVSFHKDLSGCERAVRAEA